MSGGNIERQATKRALARIGATVQRKYRIDRLIGIGGMAVVYAATHRNGHRVAIKYLHDHLLQEPDIYRLFNKEAYVANRIGHPGAVPVLDDDVDAEGCPFLIMPLLEGETLRARWERANRRLSIAEVGVLMSDVLDVLASAHQKGIIHQDIKPDNVFVTSAGAAHVLDFGIARRTNGDGHTTLTGPSIGTPAFMPPEQVLGERNASGPYSDCWAVSATIFFLLSGDFVHRTDKHAGARLVAAATRHARSLAELDANMHPSIVRFVDKGLAFAPDDRWRDALEMRDGLLAAFGDALGEPITSIAHRVRAALVEDLATAGDDPSAIQTLPIARELRGDAADHAPANRIASPPAPVDVPLLTLERATTREIADRERSAAPARGSRRAWGFALAGITALGFGTIVLGSLPARKSTGGMSLSTTLDPLLESTPPNIESSTRATALEEFGSGIQRWLDMSLFQAQDRFDDAAKTDPAFARAHLYFVLVMPGINDGIREHYRLAFDHRVSLSHRDLDVLAALAPSMQDPSDASETERRLTRLLEATHSVLLASAVARRRLRLGRPRDALQVLSMVNSKMSPAFGASTQAAVALAEGRANDARQALADCLAQSPTSGTCLEELAHLQAQDGSCSEAEMSSRRWIAAWPNDPRAYASLANALYGRTQSIETARTALERKWALIPPGNVDITRAEDAADLALRAGDVDGTRRHLDEWERLASSSSNASHRVNSATVRLNLEYDVSPPQQVAALAKRYLEQSAAWPTAITMAFRPKATRILLLTDGMSEEQATRERQAWLTVDTSGSPYARNARRWYEFFAQVAVTPRLAANAIEHLPSENPFLEQTVCTGDCAEIVGETFAVAGDAARALPHLQRAAFACTLEDPLASLRALLLLGQTLESLGKTSEACDAYHRVSAQWSRVHGSRLAGDAAARSTHLGCE